MDDRNRDDDIGRGREASRSLDRNADVSIDELARRRERSGTRPPLTAREQNERWPIG